jgi:phospholipid/cholesterol/gamma-HCH transport system substrate-binding protein
MRRWSSEITVGVSIILAIAIVIFGYIYLREIPVRQSGFEIDILFDKVTGLEVGDHISVAGLRVGRVQKLKLTDDVVRARVWLDGSIHFPQDSRAEIKSVGMIGEKYVDLILGESSAALSENDKIPGEYIDDLADAGGTAKELMTQTNSLLGKLNTVMDSLMARDADLDISKTLKNTERLTGNLDRTLSRNMGRLERTVSNLDTLLLSLKSTWMRNEQELDSTFQHIARGTERLPGVMAKLDSVLTTTKNLLTSIEDQQGAVGKALYQDDLYVRAKDAITKLNTILDDLKKNPQKYLQVRASVIDLY